MADAVLIVDNEGRVKYASAGSERLLACSVRDLVGRSLFRDVRPEDPGAVLQEIQRAATRAAELTQQLVKAVVAPRDVRGTEVVLLAEDEEIVRSLVRMILEGAGYTILEAEGGVEAIALAQSHAGQIHLLLTDVVMPRMSGPELAARLRGTRPTTKVLYMSGYSEDTLTRRGMLVEGIALLQKPMTPDALLRKVRETLDAVERDR